MGDANRILNDENQWNMTAASLSYPDSVQWQSDQNARNAMLPPQAQPESYMYRSINQNAQGPVLGLQALFAACTRIYPDQPNPLQVTARLKYWLGGPDPLDYISMYWNTGCPSLNIPPHWHYVSFGLSDLHGDGRVHPIPPTGSPQPDQISGMGLELSFRMIGQPGHPPTWPAALLQRLATYVFRTGNRLCVGDHVSWHSALDGSDEINQIEVPNTNFSDQATNNMVTKKKMKRKLKIRHMLIAQDSQLGTVDTPLGKVQFVQIVGITDRELKAAQRSGGNYVLETLAADPKFGGLWLVTDPQRRQSAPLPESTHTPSDLSGVAASCKWEYWEPNGSEASTTSNNNHRNTSELPMNIKEQIKSVLQKGLSEISLQSKEPTNTENDKEISKDFSTSEFVKTESDSAQSHASENTNVCKMSTDSIKLTLSENSSILYKSIPESQFVTQKDMSVVNMSTDSFEMSKIGAALIEDIMEMPKNIKDNFNIKKEIEFSDLDFDKTKPDNLNHTYDNDEKETSVKQEDGKIPSDSKLDCKTEKNCDDKTFSNREVNKNDSESNNNYDRSTADEVWTTNCIPLCGAHLIFDKEAGSLLLSALRCRILHGRHFTWTAINELQAITFVATSVSGALVSSEKPIVANNGWLQILITDAFAKMMADQLEPLLSDSNDSESENEETQIGLTLSNFTPAVFVWPQNKLKISIVNHI